MHRLVIVDDHPIVIHGLSALLSGSDTIQLTGSCPCLLDAVRDLAAGLPAPDVLLIDLGGAPSLREAMVRLKGIWPKAQVLFFAASPDAERAIRAMEAGARGCLLKSSGLAEIEEAIRLVAAGESYISPAFAGKIVAHLKTATLRADAEAKLRLSSREAQIVAHLLRGRTNKEIANLLTISEKTVKHYMGVLMQKLNARNRVEVVIAAQQLGTAPAGRALQGRVTNGLH